MTQNELNIDNIERWDHIMSHWTGSSVFRYDSYYVIQQRTLPSMLKSWKVRVILYSVGAKIVQVHFLLIG